MGRGLFAVVLAGLTMMGCSGTADDGTSLDVTPASTTTTTTARTTTTTTTTTTTPETPAETTEASKPPWPPSLAYQQSIYDPVADSILFVGGIPETSRVWKLDVATTTFQRLSDLPMHYNVSIPISYETAADTIVIL
jgi:hypothetical protein